MSAEGSKARTQRRVSARKPKEPAATRPTVPGYEFSAKKKGLLPWKWAAMGLYEKDTSSGRDIRTYVCRPCDKWVDVDNGVAL